VLLANFRWAADFPYATLFVNVSGSFGIGLLAAILSDEGLLSAPPSIRTLILAGFFGGFCRITILTHCGIRPVIGH
jgi:CrcB protein